MERQVYTWENIPICQLMKKPKRNSGRGTQGDDITKGGRKRKLPTIVTLTLENQPSE